MAGRAFWCDECRKWVSSGVNSTTAARKAHGREHAAERDAFRHPDLLELDAMLNGFYGGSL